MKKTIIYFVSILFIFVLFSCEKPLKKEMLTTFGILNSKLEYSNQTLDINNSALLEGLTQKANDHPKKYAERLQKATEIRRISADYVAYIESIKTIITEDFGFDEDGNLPFEQMDKGETLDLLFFKGGKITEEGQYFLIKIRNYNIDVQRIAGNFLLEEIQYKMNMLFSTEYVYSKKEGKNIEWLSYHYFGFPAIASLTKLTQLQNDVKTTENEIISGMFF